MTQPPIPSNEMDRLLSLASFDLDYTDLKDNFKDLCRLAAKVAGTNISMINLIDTYTQWTISNHGLALSQMPREDSVCQYTITENESFEVTDLTQDSRFSNRSYVVGEPHLKYYLGLPLQTNDGYNIGTLCVLDGNAKKISSEKIELLKIIADEIVNRLNTLQAVEFLKHKITEITESQKRVVHDIRGPLSGIIGLAEIIGSQGDANKMDQVLDFIKLIHKSSHSILELANEILSVDDRIEPTGNSLNTKEFNLLTLKEKLEDLYELQAKNKNINFTVHINSAKSLVPFSKNKLLQIIGNLVSNAIKFTPIEGDVTVTLNIQENKQNNKLIIEVKDMGIGMDEDKINFILKGKSASTVGTNGEQGYGFGLSLVKYLIDSLNGEMKIESTIGKVSTFTVSLPQTKTAANT